MARPKARARAHSKRRMANGRTTMNHHAVNGGLNASVVPRVLWGAVDGVEVVAVGALQIARDVLVSAVSGAANIRAAAGTATVGGAREGGSAGAAAGGGIVGTAPEPLPAT